MTRLLVLRPEPGASQTLAAARALGLDAVAAPLFTVEPVAWRRPEGDFDALMLTSANAARLAGPDLADLPVYAVGTATAAAASAKGLTVAHVGAGDAADLVAAMAQAGVRSALQLAGEVHRPAEHPTLTIVRVLVYRTIPVIQLPEAARGDAVALVHSPAAGALFARLVDEAEASRSDMTILAISAAAAEAMGEGWAAVAIAPRPSDAALLAIAADLCEGASADDDRRP